MDGLASLRLLLLMLLLLPTRPTKNILCSLRETGARLQPYYVQPSRFTYRRRRRRRRRCCRLYVPVRGGRVRIDAHAIRGALPLPPATIARRMPPTSLRLPPTSTWSRVRSWPPSMSPTNLWWLPGCQSAVDCYRLGRARINSASLLLLAHIFFFKPVTKKNLTKTKPWTGDHSARPSMKSAASREN